jgi:protein-L-isoaspartate(D-aspartate) O-methyltransferase
VGVVRDLVIETPELAKARKRMVEEILVARGIADPLVLGAMAKVPRHLFVEEALWNHAYGDHSLPIGERQTISQPYVVALMTQSLELKGMERVLEIGTGSGYQTAVLAEIVCHVFSVERIPRLARQARVVLDRLGYSNTAIKVGDGWHGWRENGPFDAILVTAASKCVPERLLEQLVDEGVLVVPLWCGSSQELYRIRRKAGGSMEKENLGPCRFVEMISSSQGNARV